MEGMGLKFTPVNSKMPLRPSKHVWAYGCGLIASPNHPNGGFSLSSADHPPPPPTPPLQPTHPL